MTNSANRRKPHRLIIIAVAFIVLASLPFVSRARSTSTSTSVNVVNNSNHQIRNVYLASSYDGDWSGNQLGDATISTGQSVNVNVPDCDHYGTVIAEDEDGCFFSFVATCGTSATFTITNDTQRNCGGQ
jgi:hypothetical protein